MQLVIEKFTQNTRFCLIANHVNKIIPAIQSRCTKFRFGPLDPEQIRPRLDHIIEQEGFVNFLAATYTQLDCDPRWNRGSPPISKGRHA